MSDLSRRSFLAAGAAVAVSCVPAYSAEVKHLPAGARAGGMSLMEALKLRRSTRLYSDEPIDAETLSNLLWAAYGFNRPESGGRTPPSWHTSYGGDLYVGAADGIWLYDPKEESLQQVTATDIRKKASSQPFVGTAPIVILHVTDLDRMYQASDEDRMLYAHVDSAIVAQNIYLFCAAAGLGTCLVGGADKKAVAEALTLSERKIVTYVQPVGHPKAG